MEKIIIDLEVYAKEGKSVPKAQKYKFKVDREHYTVEQERMTGREILILAGKNPVEKYQLNQRSNGGKVVKIDYDQVVDFTEPGIEKFMTIPLDQTEGGK
ncbi:hypothetical protein D1164_04565 [Mariniphaga sediminis]|uniref:Multi-ubiquitin domain-containing protein n=1 Tax=Mariniphaga sediminis TaxID=1628158 RepID=A0A399D3H9_9BACT|nr:multiubiquitin domain-containing protein [Mariniphaga sediminis]RIH66189.1 hypothetical protein D1164_04565 [Mariniphaga sediminis]